MNELFRDLMSKLEGWLDTLILMTPNLVAALLIVIASALVGKLVSRGFYQLLSRVSHHNALNELARKLVRVVFVILGVMIALHVLHLDKAATTFLAGAGIVGIAIGFAFQDMSANFIAGIFMAIKRPFVVGDLLETHGYLGIVDSIELRSTVICTLDGQLVRIPNKEIFQNPFVNLSKRQQRRVDVVVGVSYDDDLDLVEETARKAIETVERDEERDIEVFFTGFGGSSIDLVARFWVRYDKHTDYLRALSLGVKAVKKAFDAKGISIPFPIRTLELGGAVEAWTERLASNSKLSAGDDSSNPRASA